MPDDIFRIVVAVAVGLACIAFLVQVGVAIGLYRAVRKIQEKAFPLVEKAEIVVGKAGPVVDKIGPVIEKVEPVIQKVGPAVDQATAILTTAGKILEDVRPRISEIATEAAAIAKTGRKEVEHLTGLVHEAGDRAKDRLEQIDHSVDATIEQVEQAGDSVKRAVMRPVREVNGIAAGISAAVASLVRRKSSVDTATQDEEMFI
ncbi:MAG: hypothetical protein C5B51_10860 [Terriglobia bacterium]|nr:MAG: hypothetical protein C5B51_10860 [Terriglobia bacterium]